MRCKKVHKCGEPSFHMALLVVTGLPSSGRSTRIDELARFLEGKITGHPTLSQVKVVRGEDVHADLSVYECKCAGLMQPKKVRVALVPRT